MSKATTFTAALVLLSAMGASGYAETMVKTGKTPSGDTCSVTVEKHADGSVAAVGSSSTTGSTVTTGSAGSVASSSSAGGSSVHVQAGGGSVSSSSSTSGGPGSTAAGTVTVNGCTISMTSR